MVKKVLFACTQNSFRSQVAEAFFNSKPPKEWVAISAGPKPSNSVNPKAIELMRERGVDISGKTTRKLTREMESEADIVVIVCGSECPIVNAKYVEHWSVENPAEMSLDDAREVVNEIEEKVNDLIDRISRGITPFEKQRFSLSYE